MIIAISPFTDPYVNLSIEETLLNDLNIKEDIFYLFQNDNTIVIGRNQNGHEEINKSYVAKNEVKICRRVSGGGAVYQDLGNLNFSFITTNKRAKNFKKFLKPVILFLISLGLNAKFSGKNDIEIDGFKVSGSAQYVGSHKMFHHGTLLFDSDMQKLVKSLKPNKLKLESKGIKSVRKRVKNIKSFLQDDINMEEFKKKLVDFVAKRFKKRTFLDLKTYKLKEVKKLAKTRKSYDWIFQKNPPFTLKNEKRFANGTISLYLNVVKNKIKNIAFFGDFLSKNDFEQVYKFFLNQIYSETNIKKILQKIPKFKEYFGKLSRKDLLKLFFN